MRALWKTIGCGLVASLMLAAAPAKAQIANGFFDNPGTLTGWTVTGGVSDTTATPQSPTKSAVFFNAAAVLGQTFTVAAAGDYILSFWLRSATTVADTMAVISYTINSSPNFFGLGTNAYQLNTARVTLNAGQNFIKFFDASSENGRPVQLDTISLSPVDVPVPLAGAGAASFIAGLAGLGMMARYRRRSGQALA